jgi:hypothetical protein
MKILKVTISLALSAIVLVGLFIAWFVSVVDLGKALGGDDIS